MKIISAKGFAGPIEEGNRIKVANSIAKIVDELVPGGLPGGDRPIEVEHGAPIQLWDVQDHTGAVYRIRVGSEGGFFQRFAYELGHELGHTKMGPHRSNVLIEVCAELISLCTVRGIGSAWLRQSPYRDKNINWTGLASVDDYIAKAEAKAIDNLPAAIIDAYKSAGYDDRVKLLQSVRAEIEKQKLTDKESRAFQQASAHLILRKGDYWLQDLLGIAMHTDPSPEQDPECRKDLPVLPDAIPAWIPDHLR